MATTKLLKILITIFSLPKKMSQKILRGGEGKMKLANILSSEIRFIIKKENGKTEYSVLKASIEKMRGFF